MCNSCFQKAVANAALPFLVLCVAVACVPAEPEPRCDVLESPQLLSLSDAMAEATEDKTGKWSGQVYECEIGPYVIYVPVSRAEGDERNIVVLHGTDDPVLYVLGSRNTLWGEGRPIVSIDDQDDDGSFDFLTYFVRRKGSPDELEVMDRNLDGQPDARVEHRAGEGHLMWLWVENGWYEKVNGKRLVLVNEIETPYESSDGTFVFGEDNGQ